jgi:hypothetical protein
LAIGVVATIRSAKTGRSRLQFTTELSSLLVTLSTSDHSINLYGLVENEIPLRI